MLLTLKAASSKDDLAAVTQAGAAMVLSDEMLQLASHDSQAHSNSRESAGNEKQQRTDSEPFLKSAQHLLEQMGCSAVGLGQGANQLKHLALVASHTLACCKLPPAARAQSPLQKLFAPIHAFIMHITASFFLAKTVIGVMVNQVNMLATTEQQARRIGEWLLGIQTAVQRQMQQGSSVFLVNAALAMIASVLRSGAVAHKSAKQGSAQHRLTLHQALPCFSQLEEYTLARYAPHLLHRLIPFSAGTLKRSHAQQ